MPGAQVQTPFYGFDHVTLVRAHGDEPGGDYDRWLDAARSQGESPARPANSLPHDYTVPQAYRTAIPEELYATVVPRRPRRAYLRGRRCRRAVLPDGVVSRSAPSVQSARQILGHVQARAVSGARGIPAQRLDAAGAGLQHHQGPRGRQSQPHRHEHHRRVGARGAGGEGADLRHDRLRRRRHRRACSPRSIRAAGATTPW